MPPLHIQKASQPAPAHRCPANRCTNSIHQDHSHLMATQMCHTPTAAATRTTCTTILYCIGHTITNLVSPVLSAYRQMTIALHRVYGWSHAFVWSSASLVTVSATQSHTHSMQYSRDLECFSSTHTSLDGGNTWRPTILSIRHSAPTTPCP